MIIANGTEVKDLMFNNTLINRCYAQDVLVHQRMSIWQPNISTVLLSFGSGTTVYTAIIDITKIVNIDIIDMRTGLTITSQDVAINTNEGTITFSYDATAKTLTKIDTTKNRAIRTSIYSYNNLVYTFANENFGLKASTFSTESTTTISQQTYGYAGTVGRRIDNGTRSTRYLSFTDSRLAQIATEIINGQGYANSWYYMINNLGALSAAMRQYTWPE